MWSGFRGKSTTDLVFVGTSQAECAINPSIINASLGTHSYNMATNMQSLSCSFDAIKTAFREKNVKKAVLCIDIDILSTARNNVEEKIKKTLTDSSGHRDENGYEPTDEVVNQSHFTTKEEAETWSAEHDLIVPTITDENRRTLSSILAYCSANNIELTVISIPAPNTFDIYEYKDYLALTDTVDEICSDAGQQRRSPFSMTVIEMAVKIAVEAGQG